jgi:hypothetical protein
MKILAPLILMMAMLVPQPVAAADPGVEAATPAGKP